MNERIYSNDYAEVMRVQENKITFDVIRKEDGALFHKFTSKDEAITYATRVAQWQVLYKPHERVDNTKRP